jgi:hypothetical protein
MQAISPWDDVAFSSTEGDRHLGIRPVSQLNTWPVVSPVNASRRPSRDAAHHSGSGRLARPSPWGTFTSYSLPASWRTPLWVNRVTFTQCRLLPVLPWKRTSSDQPPFGPVCATTGLMHRSKSTSFAHANLRLTHLPIPSMPRTRPIMLHTKTHPKSTEKKSNESAQRVSFSAILRRRKFKASACL